MLYQSLDFFIKRKLLVNLLIIVVVISGMFSMFHLKRESMPEIDLYEIHYTTIYPGASPEDVEQKVTIPLEDAVKGVDDIKRISSTSFENVSSIKIELEDYLTQDDADTRKQDIQKAIDRVTDLPAEVIDRPELFEIEMTKMPIIEIALAHPDKLELRKAAKYLTKKLERLNPVSKVTKIGYLDKEVYINLDPYKLIKTETAITDVLNNIKGKSIRLSGGKLKAYNNQKVIVTDEEIKKPQQAYNTIIRSSFDGKTLRVKDIGTVEETLEEQNLIVRSNGIEGISLAIIKKENSDVIRAIKEIKKLLEKEKQNLPKKLTYSFVNDESDFTRNRINIVASNAFIGIILVMLSLKVFLDFKTAMWTAFGIPFSLLISFVVLKLIGMSINPLSLGGFIIVIGMLVDDAIVVAENIKRHKEMGKAELQAVRDGVFEVAVPVITTISTTIVAFAPLMFMTGIMGKFMKVIPVIVIVTLLASLFESLFFLPAHLRHKTNTKKSFHKKDWVKKLENKYKALLEALINKRYLVIVVAMLIFISSIFSAKQFLKFEIMPSGDIDSFNIYMEAPIGTSIDKMSDMVKKMEQQVAKISNQNMHSFGTRIGTDSQYSSETTGTKSHMGVIYVYLNSKEKRKVLATDIIKELKSNIKPLYKQFEKVTIELKKFGPPVGKPIDVKLISDNNKQRKKAGNELLNFVENLPGTIDTRNDNPFGKKEYKVNINNNKLSQLGISVFDVASTIRTAYEGVIIFTVREDNEDVNYRLIMDEKYRKDTKFLIDLPVRNHSGNLIRIKQFASLQEQNSTLEINRYDNQRAYSITSEIEPKKTTSIDASKKIKNYFYQNIASKYPEVDLIVSGEAEASKDSLVTLLQSFIMAILGIYFLLILMFNSFTQPIFVLSAIPFGLVGIIWAFIFHGQNLCFPAIMGFVGLSGVVVNDSLIMVDYINKTSKDCKTKEEFKEMVLEGAKTRLRPIILTSVTTVLGLMPTVYGWGGTDLVLVPMTMSLGYGLAFATVITLFLVPTLTMIHRDFYLYKNKK